MGVKKENMIKNIQHGRLDIYVPLKFETKYDYVKLCNRINNAIDIDYNKYLDKNQESLQNICERHIQRKVLDIKYGGKLPFKYAIKRLLNHRKITKTTNKSSRGDDGTQIALFPTEKGLDIEVKYGEISIFDDRHEELEIEYNQHQKLYGTRYVNMHKRFILLPAHIKLNSGEFVWINAIVYVFGNKMGVLKLELSLINQDSQPLMDYDFDLLIEEVDDKYNIFSTNKKMTFEEIYDVYLRKFINVKGVDVTIAGKAFRNIIMTQFDGVSKQIANIPNDIQEDLFRIIAAPVPDNDNTFYRNKAREYIENHSWSQDGIKYIVSTTGGCLSIIDTERIDEIFRY